MNRFHCPFFRGKPTKPELITHYKGRPLKKHYIPDFFVLGQIVVELKAIAELLSEHEAQLFNYMRISRTSVGYLVNFGHKGTLEWKRYILTDGHTKTGEDCQHIN